MFKLLTKHFYIHDVFISNLCTANVWIGLNHRNRAGVFIEASGDPVQFQSFVGMEPNNLELYILLKYKRLSNIQNQFVKN